MDQRRPAVSTEQGVGERVRAARQVEHDVADVGGHQLAEGIPALLELLRQEVRVGTLRIRHAGRGHPDPVGEGGGAGRNAVPERAMELGCGGEDSPALLAREARVRREEVRLDVAHRDPGGIPGTFDRDDAVADRGRHPVERPGEVELGRASLVVRRAREPVGARRAHPLQDERGAVVAERPDQRRTGIAAVGERFEPRRAELLEE